MSTASNSLSTPILLPRRTGVQGFSLIELLVALAIGLVIVAAMSQLFVNISRSNLELSKTNSQMESARFAMQFLENDIIHAGYWGGFIPEFDDLTWPIDDDPNDLPAAKPATVCLPLLVDADWNTAYRDYLFGIPIEVFGPGATPGGCAGVIPDRLAGTDLLIVRHAANCIAGDPGCEAFDANEMYLRVSNCEGDVNRYSVDPASYVLREIDCDLVANPAARRRFVQNIYYIRDWAYENAPKDGIPTLVRSQFEWDGTDRSQQQPEALVEGIERFHVEVGIDLKSQTNEDIDQTAAIIWADEDERTTPRNRGDGVPENGFQRCLSEAVGCTAEDLANVVSVKIYLLARANEITQGYTDSKAYTLGSLNVPAFNDNFKRHVFSKTIRVNNVAGRRETPFDISEWIP